MMKILNYIRPLSTAASLFKIEEPAAPIMAVSVSCKSNRL
jgi:hypothetical protein